jgi:hypothetical protein
VVVILQANNIVFAKIVSELHFDQDHHLRTGIAKTVVALIRNVDVFTWLELEALIAADDISHSADHDPVLGTPGVALQAEAGAGFNLDPLYFVAFALFEHFITPPWALVLFSHRLLPFVRARAHAMRALVV